MGCGVQDADQGLLIGSGAGLTTAAILGLFYWVRLRWRRSQQIRYWKQFIFTAFDQIGTDIAGTGGTEKWATSPNRERSTFA